MTQSSGAKESDTTSPILQFVCAGIQIFSDVPLTLTVILRVFPINEDSITWPEKQLSLSFERLIFSGLMLILTRCLGISPSFIGILNLIPESITTTA